MSSLIEVAVGSWSLNGDIYLHNVTCVSFLSHNSCGEKGRFEPKSS